MQDRLIILTGMSGAGKSTAIFAFEEMRYQVIENPPADLFPSLFQLIHQQMHSTKSVVSISLFNLGRALKALERIPDLKYTVLCLVAGENELISRYKLTRHIHPLQTEGYTLSLAIQRDQQFVNDLRSSISVVLDTSGLSVTHFRQKLFAMYAPSERKLNIGLVTFGFKNGIPSDADFVFDLRILQNPYYDESLRNLSGQDEAIIQYVETQPLFRQLLDQALSYLHVVIPQLIKEERSYYQIAIGCTGGRHRSVVFARALAKRLPELYAVGIMLIHRDLHKINDQE